MPLTPCPRSMNVDMTRKAFAREKKKPRIAQGVEQERFELGGPVHRLKKRPVRCLARRRSRASLSNYANGNKYINLILPLNCKLFNLLSPPPCPGQLRAWKRVSVTLVGTVHW